jgi:ATP-dependent DNA helicase RecQ
VLKEPPNVYSAAVTDPQASRYTDPEAVLRSVFGYQEFRPGQRKIIEAVLAGRDCIGLMPTGAGKSLTFQIPAKIFAGPVVVISPLISLMKDQVDALVRTGFRATVLNSTIDWPERRARLDALRRKEIELLYLAPEALNDGLRAELAAARPSLLVVDEAHCISHWGHDFRPAYRQLVGLKAQFGDIPILALTATATRRVVGDILKQLGMRKPDGFKGSFFRPNLVITTIKKGEGRTGRDRLLNMVLNRSGDTGIVYCISRNSVEETARWLRANGVKALPYHAKLTDEERAANQNAFARDECDVIVATVAFGMGIDKSNVRFVIHSDMPRNIESWYQEIGRAGRDGLLSDCIVMYSWADVITYDRFLESVQDADLRQEMRSKTVALLNLLESPRCRHQALTAYFDEQIDECGSSCDRCRQGATQELTGTVARPPVSRGPAKGSVPPEVEDPELFDLLRKLRKQVADGEGVPAYVVFSDATLRQMVAKKPRTRSSLLAVAGVGKVKLERYGPTFLDAIRGYAPTPRT